MTKDNSLSTLMFGKESIHEYGPILAFVLISILIGLFVLGDYGESWDELKIRNYAAHTLKNYGLFLDGERAVDFSNGHLDHYGPIFFVGTSIFAQSFVRIFGEGNLIDGWHLAYFLTFEISIFFMYALSRRFFGRLVSFCAALLYGSQPLLWGHAFINPKDIPFMVIFLAAVTLGLKMVDRAAEFQALSKLHELKPLRWYWETTEPKNRVIALVGLTFVIVCTISLPGIGRSLEGFAEQLVVETFVSKSENLFSTILNTFIPQAASSSVEYLTRRAQIYSWLIVLELWSLTFIVVGLFSARHFTKLRYWQAKRIIRYLKSYFSSPLCIAAAAALGIAVSTRVLGVYALVIVGIYAIYQVKEKTLVLVGAYLVVASVITYIAWPYLWGNPILSYLSSLVKMADFPWDGELLFEGQLYQSANLPWYYLPKLIALQLTEPVVLLFFIGMGLSILQSLRRVRVPMLMLVLIWFWVPMGMIVVLGSTLNDNFRHIFFLLPPVFLFAAVGLEWLFQKIRSGVWRFAIVGVLLIPAVYGLVVLHPYQYVYYNSFVGGNAGAFRIYEMDYWLTSYDEMGSFLNRHADPDSQVMVFGPSYLLQNALREDIQIVHPKQDLTYISIDYAVVPARKNDDLLGCRNAPVIYRVERAGAILGVVKAPESAGQCP